MDAVNWALIGFWGCGLALLFSGWSAVVMDGEDIKFLLGVIATILSFIGMCLFGMLLWN